MDWPKAKTILIIAFLATDLFLVVSLGFQGYKATEYTDRETILAVLERQNIYVQVSLPQKHSDMPVVYVQHEKYDEAHIEALLAACQPLPPNTREDVEYQKEAERFIRDVGISQETLVFDKILQDANGTTVVFRNEIGGIPIEKSAIFCTFKEGVLVEFEWDWLRVDGFNNRKQETISAIDALLVFMEMKPDAQEGRIVIEGVQMVYWLDENSINVNAIMDTAIPAWKITYNGGSVEYINAYEQ